MSIVSDLRHAAAWVAEAAEQGAGADFIEPYHALRRAAEQAGTAWSGSWLPALSHLYDRELAPLPVALRLLVGSGAEHLPMPVQTRCRSWSPAEMRAAILASAGLANDWALQDLALGASAIFNEAQLSLLAPLECAAAERPWDHMLEQLVAAANQITIIDKYALIEAWRPKYSRLHGLRTRRFDAAPPHIDMLASLDAMLSPFEGLLTVAGLMHQAADHLKAGGPPSLSASPPRGLAAAPAAQSR